MIRTIEDFETTWKFESQATAKTMVAITDENKSQAICDDHRNLARIAWHIVTTIAELVSQTGLKLTAVDPKAPLPATVEEIQKGYAEASVELLHEVKANWDDAALLTENDLYGEKWRKGKALDVLVRHEVHHRAQMTVLLRQAGAVVPGIYGPAKEEWSQFGQEAPEI